ncbi:MAG: hemerythrin domain-containing protein [Candidatus Omnitrophica bacterium]|nr:hemerythrin domain-containing protein [Candidatus Omnitrophota bacterium]
MIEHRLIERMIKLMRTETSKINNGEDPKVQFLHAVTDFIKTYADQCHHGKEENILFKSLVKKPLSEKHKQILNELAEEHIFARKKTRGLEEAIKKYLQGESSAIPKISQFMHELTEFYPQHIEKEDKQFFLPCMDYYSKSELDTLLNDFMAFDKDLVHEKYKEIVYSWEADQGDTI